MYSTAASVASQPQKGNNDAAPASSPPKPSSASPSLTDANPAAAAQEDNEQGPSGKTPKGLRFWLIIFSLLIATFLSALDLTSISTALPRIAEELESQDYSWIGNAYSITSTCFIPWLGGLVDIFRRRPVLLVGLVSCAVGSAMCGAANAMERTAS